MTQPTGDAPKPKSSLTPLQKVLAFLAPFIFIAGGVLLLTPVLDKEIDRVEMVYGVKIAEAPKSFLNRGIIVIDRDQNRIRCQLPSKGEVERGEPMECKDRQGNTQLIQMRRPV